MTVRVMHDSIRLRVARADDQAPFHQADMEVVPGLEDMEVDEVEPNPMPARRKSAGGQSGKKSAPLHQPRRVRGDQSAVKLNPNRTPIAMKTRLMRTRMITKTRMMMTWSRSDKTRPSRPGRVREKSEVQALLAPWPACLVHYPGLVRYQQQSLKGFKH